MTRITIEAVGESDFQAIREVRRIHKLMLDSLYSDNQLIAGEATYSTSTTTANATATIDHITQ